MTWLKVIQRDIVRLRFVVNVFIATTITRYLTPRFYEKYCD